MEKEFRTGIVEHLEMIYKIFYYLNMKLSKSTCVSGQLKTN
jgi:hypothetical protein